jgi:5-methylcytosine-specific restriction endonuclease McrA
MPSKPPMHRPPGYRSREEQLRQLDAQRGSAASRGYDQAWRKLRARFLQVHPLCCVEACGEKATIVDHISSIRDRPDLRLEWSNLRPMCNRCHSARTSREQSWNRKK